MAGTRRWRHNAVPEAGLEAAWGRNPADLVEFWAGIVATVPRSLRSLMRCLSDALQ